jgi:hypothetical protein
LCFFFFFEQTGCYLHLSAQSKTNSSTAWFVTKIAQLIIVGWLVRGKDFFEKGGVEKHQFDFCAGLQSYLTTESVKGTALSLESIDNVHCGDGLSSGVLSVGNSVTNNVLQEDLKDTTSLVVDLSRDTLYTSSASKTSDGWLGDTLNVVTKDLSMALSSTLSESLTALSAASAGHCFELKIEVGF